MFPLILTASVVIGLLLWSLYFRLDSMLVGEYSGFGLLFAFIIVSMRVGFCLLVWLTGMLIWSMWFRGQ